MGEVSDRLDAMTVKVGSPDGNIQAVYVGGAKLQVRFRPGSYEGYRASSLELQLSQLGRLLWTGFRRGYNQVMDEVAGTGRDNDRPEDEWDANQRRFRIAQREITARAIGKTKLVRAQAVGLFDWKVDIKPEALTKLSEREFVAEIEAVGTAVNIDHNEQVRKLLMRHFDVRYPARH